MSEVHRPLVERAELERLTGERADLESAMYDQDGHEPTDAEQRELTDLTHRIVALHRSIEERETTRAFPPAEPQPEPRPPQKASHHVRHLNGARGPLHVPHVNREP